MTTPTPTSFDGYSAIHMADQAVVDELKAISELKCSFLKKELDLSPQLTIMLAEIQEQQSLMKTYEITIKKLECEIETKESKVSLMKTASRINHIQQISRKKTNLWISREIWV
ncbi:hypothetical protein Q3G72_014713 [Acer saccharum]|nr:hypothetical protein Q3G72_014713 [Acer saccharum]